MIQPEQKLFRKMENKLNTFFINVFKCVKTFSESCVCLSNSWSKETKAKQNQTGLKPQKISKQSKQIRLKLLPTEKLPQNRTSNQNTSHIQVKYSICK